MSPQHARSCTRYLILPLVFLAVGTSGQVAPGVKEVNAAATKLFKEEKFLEAAQAWHALLKTSAKNLPVKLRVVVGRRAAIAYWKGGRQDRARDLVAWCVKQAPGDEVVKKLQQKMGAPKPAAAASPAPAPTASPTPKPTATHPIPAPSAVPGSPSPSAALPSPSVASG